ncbi:MAG: polyprenyl diphosphate synthase [Defluviitaleaceae bacterium]|nr:polyprenyl diphosphate synthase [Defluviitaleaceae bacterium]
MRRLSNLPSHIAIIMDGNGRWASRRFLTRNAGHKAGAENLRKLCKRMNAVGFENLTVYAFSTENWERPAGEVSGLMQLLSDFIQRHIDEADSHTMRMHILGDVSRLDTEMQKKIQILTEKTKAKTGLRVNIAINYGGRDELLRASRAIAKDAANGRINVNGIDNALLNSYLDTVGLPDPEIVIRTGGDKRLSNFLLWQSAYSEIFFVKKFWPDFSFKDILKIVKEFKTRKRRFGKV